MDAFLVSLDVKTQEMVSHNYDILVSDPTDGGSGINIHCHLDSDNIDLELEIPL
jgi:hypothetical protein